VLHPLPAQKPAIPAKPVKVPARNPSKPVPVATGTGFDGYGYG
jgi:hypothetical protein